MYFSVGNGNSGNNGNYGNWRNDANDPYNNRNGNNGTAAPYGNGRQDGNYVRQSGRGASTQRTVTVPASQQWTDAGLDVRRDQVIQFHASGNVALSRNPGDNGTQEGARIADGWRETRRCLA